MTTLAEPSIEIGVDYPCGCKERWMVSHLPDDEPLLIVLDGDCHPEECYACAPFYTSARGGHHCPNGRKYK